MDSYISDELLVETNHGVLRHLENCVECRRELSDRRNLRLRVSFTIKNALESQINPVFAAQLTANLRNTALRPSTWETISSGRRFLNMRLVAASFACILILAIGGLVFFNLSNGPVINTGKQDPQLDNNDNSQIADAVRVSWKEITEQAVGDHENCAVEFGLKEEPISLDEAAKRHGAYAKDLDKVVMAALKSDPNESVSGDTELIKAHSCLFDGRRFAHIIVRHKGRVVSMLVTETDLPADNNDIRTEPFDGALNAAGFRFGHHAVFVVSELPEAENASLARSIAPAIRLHTGKVGA